jgi:hypothetical protein
VLLPLSPMKVLSTVPPMKVSSLSVPVASSFAVNGAALILIPLTALLGRTGAAIFRSLSPLILTVNAGVPGVPVNPAKSVVSLVISFFSVSVLV